jgi:hypothetical protein
VCDVFILYNLCHSYMLLIKTELIKFILCGCITVCDVFTLYNSCHSYMLLIKKELIKLIGEIT